MESDSSSVYHSKAFPFNERMNCLTMRSPLVLALLHVSMKWVMCFLGFPKPLNCWNFGVDNPEAFSTYLCGSFEMHGVFTAFVAGPWDVLEACLVDCRVVTCGTSKALGSMLELETSVVFILKGFSE
ncbi:hypothetical protein LIER_00790 [Lithospermum erythrorhizon]|uniref:Uncharacterized protein n=1 Tax=Lithospermum erythrorhizon TaxID=34254 RepID=A0AAV3NIJ8_LITER